MCVVRNPFLTTMVWGKCGRRGCMGPPAVLVWRPDNAAGVDDCRAQTLIIRRVKKRFGVLQMLRGESTKTTEANIKVKRGVDCSIPFEKNSV